MGNAKKKSVGFSIAAATLASLFTPGTSAQAAPTNTPLPKHIDGNLAKAVKPTLPQKKQTQTQVSYVVKPGDSVWKISHQFKISMSALISANKLPASGLIHPGQRLIIPTPAVSSAALTSASAPVSTPSKAKTATKAETNSTTKTNPVYHTVVRGDSLWKIATKYKTSIDSLKRLNQLPDSGLIHPGQKLLVSGTPVSTPASSTASSQKSSSTTTKSTTAKPAQTTTAATSTTSAKATEITYIVKRGDTLGAIARAHKTTVAQIAADNRIANPALIRIGQKLIIKSVSATPTTAATPSNSTSTERKQLVPNTFLTYTYDDKTVAAANDNKYALLAMNVPSRAEVQQMIIKTAKEMGVDPKLALAHAYVESGFDARAVSPANALSVMQVIPTSGVWAGNMVGRPLNLLNTQDNIVAGIAIIRWLQQNARSFDEGIAGYYQGLGGVKRNGMRPDTVKYVAKVKAAMARF